MDQNICRRQFSCRSFGFRCKEEEKNLFYRLQCCENRTAYLIYRLFVCLYSLGWLLAGYIWRGINDPGRLQLSYRYFTVWGEWGNAIYFTLALTLSAIGVAKRKRSNRMESVFIKILRSVTWMFFTLATNCQTVMLVVYWSVLNPNGENLNHFNVHQHLITFILIFIETFMAAFPIRIYHVVYAMLVGTVYILMTVFVHVSGDPNAIYPFLNWGKYPGIAAGISLGLVGLGTLLIQFVFFGFYCLRLALDKALCGKRRHSESRKSTVSTVSGDTNSTERGNRAYDFATDISDKCAPQANDYF